MKEYKQDVASCDLCPAIKYRHSDGEGESSPCSWLRAFCGKYSRELSNDLILDEYRKKLGPPYYWIGIPERIIPDWCELEDI